MTATSCSAKLGALRIVDQGQLSRAASQLCSPGITTFNAERGFARRPSYMIAKSAEELKIDPQLTCSGYLNHKTDL